MRNNISLFSGIGGLNLHVQKLMAKIEELPDVGGLKPQTIKNVGKGNPTTKNSIECRGILDLNGINIPCYVLKDGTRVLSGRGLQEALKMVDESKKTSGHRVVRYLNQKTLSPFISKYLESGHFEPVICYDGNKKVNGYKAEILPDICDAFLQARKEIELSPRQAIIADQCEILLRAFARVGITALVDEATGYQGIREKDELQKILKAYISEELLPWQKRFPDTFYKELFRLNGWDFTIKDIRKRPSIIGKWTTKLVYEQLPKGVLEELKKQTPKNEEGKYKAKLHQSLTPDIGNPNLEKQITKVVALFQVSDNMRQFWQLFERMQDRLNGQLMIPFEFDEEGHTKD